MFGRSTTDHRERREAERARNLAVLLSGGTGLHRGTYAGGTSGEVVEKANMLQHAGYMAAVRNLGYCMRCRRSCRPQFCHRDQGKGERIKTDVREGWPGCAECHWIVGTSGQYPKEERRALELELGRRTRHAVRAAGSWPVRLAEWPEE